MRLQHLRPAVVDPVALLRRAPIIADRNQTTKPSIEVTGVERSRHVHGPGRFLGLGGCIRVRLTAKGACKRLQPPTGLTARWQLTTC